MTVNGLKCEVTYTIIAGGTLNGSLLGPRSSHGTVNTTIHNGTCEADDGGGGGGGGEG